MDIIIDDLKLRKLNDLKVIRVIKYGKNISLVETVALAIMEYSFTKSLDTSDILSDVSKEIDLLKILLDDFETYGETEDTL